ncbi:MAG: hypothetical protein WD873_06370, partial [Candidatus Hydrogenedentales bacterium]
MSRFGEALIRAASRPWWEELRPQNEVAVQAPFIRRILLVRPTRRMGNTLLSTPAVSLCRQNFPNATLDILTTRRHAPLFQGLPVGTVYALDWQWLHGSFKFQKLMSQLRRQPYDLILDGGFGS